LPSSRRAAWLGDIVENCDRIGRHIAGLSREAYLADERTIDAVERCLQRICESATRLKRHEQTEPGQTFLEAVYPDIPWADVRKMGDILRHKYDRIDDDLVWTTVNERLHPLREAAAREIARLRGLA
jgi:uncharacterized protein with HEPN domain